MRPVTDPSGSFPARDRARAVRPAVRLAASLALLCAGGAAVPAALAEGSVEAGTDGAGARLLAELSSEVAAVREQAAQRLDGLDSLGTQQIVAAIRESGPRARPLLFGLAASRGVVEAVPDLAAGAAGADSLCAEAAIRALVTLGDDAVAAGRDALAAAQPETLSERERDARLRHLQALDVQNRVEREVLKRWRRKGGTYSGRYAALAQFGWDAQPVLLAMLLDVPLEDQFVVVPPTGDEETDVVERMAAISRIASSRRRGYRTFQPLPTTIDVDELFDLAQQALADVADLRVMGDVLRDTHDSLIAADRRVRWRPRRPEDAFAQDIEVILARRGDATPLEERRAACELEVRQTKRLLGRRDPEDAAEYFQMYNVRLGDLAVVLQHLQLWDLAAERYAEMIGIVKRLTGKEPAITGYNRACALACGGRIDEAIAQLGRSLDPEISSGTEDLTREWVCEDGDLDAIRSDPRYAKIVLKRFGP